MATILESVMLICFGCSWPMSLMTNIRAKSAKGMNLWFYVTILVGYLAGITAKLVAHNITYVLAIYIINLIFVFSNIVVYFRNRKFDKEKVIIN